MSAPLRKPRSDQPPLRRVLIAGALTIAVVVGVLWVGLSAYNGVPLRGYSHVTVELPHIGNLIDHDPVRIAGVRVGQIESEDTTAAGKAKITLQLEPGVTLPSDTTVAVRSNGLLGARYVELIPGRGGNGNLADGATIKARGDVLSNGVPETLDTLDAQTRGGLGKTVNGLGQGFLGNGEALNRGIASAAPAMTTFQHLSAALLAPRARLGAFVPSLDHGLTPLDANKRRLAAMLPPLSRTLEPFQRERAAVREALALAPSTLTTAGAGLTRGRRLLASADALATAVHATLPTVPAGLRSTTRLLDDAPQPLERANTLLHTALGAVPAVLRITAALSPVLSPLRSGLAHLSPMLTYIAPFKCDIVGFATNFRSMTGFGGVGKGPGGQLQEFRASVVPSSEIVSSLGKTNASGQAVTRNYAPPCSYPASTYTTIGKR